MNLAPSPSPDPGHIYVIRQGVYSLPGYHFSLGIVRNRGRSDRWGPDVLHPDVPDSDVLQETETSYRTNQKEKNSITIH